MKFLEEFFYYTRAERNGAFVLSALILLVILAPRFYPLFFPEHALSGDEFREEVAAFWRQEEGAAGGGPASATLFPFDPNTLPEDSLRLLGLSEKLARTLVRYRERVGPFRQPADLKKIYTLKAEDYERLAPYIRIGRNAPAPGRKPEKTTGKELAGHFPFDPNTASEAELKRLGLSARVASNILKYREKGGRFRDAEGFSRVYGLSAGDYERLAPYIRIEKTGAGPQGQGAPESRPVSYVSSPAQALVDINQATAEEWQQLRGIGPAYARRIVAFRDKLGGFTHVGQVAETFGLPDSIFQGIRPRLQHSPVLRRIFINEADVQSLQAHPYLNWRQANAIVAYRANHGPFNSVEDVKKVKALPPEVVEKLEGYLAY